MSERVLLHVGTPKTGTSYLQDVLFRNRERLLDAGLCYPADRFDDHFLAALDLQRLTWGGLEAEAVGAWDRLADRVRRHEGTAIVSHEVFAAASMITFENFMPVRLSELAGGEARAAVIMGPVAAGAWLVFAVGAAAAGRGPAAKPAGGTDRRRRSCARPAAWASASAPRGS